jgi:hypothetical protein
MKNKNKLVARKGLMPFSKDNIEKWVLNDTRNIREKALIMIHSGISDKAVCSWLNITKDDIDKILHIEYENDNAMIKLLNSKLRVPGNYSTWVNKVIYNSWNSRKIDDSVESIRCNKL